MKKPLIEVCNVSFAYGDKQIIDSATFSIAESSIVSIMGPSGCGKSTALRIISGLETPSAGVCRFDGAKVISPPANLRYSFQDYDAFPWLTVESNLRLFGEKPRKLARITKVLQRIGLVDHRAKFPAQLSGGMRKRLALGRCIVGAPKAILLDEPFSSLDVSARDDLHELVLDLARETGCTFVIVTHDIDEAIFLSNRVFISDPLPFQVRKVIDVPFPYPRSKNIRQADEFENLHEEIRSHQLPAEFIPTDSHVMR
jgi:NitT/TauT family transport system ATP-binding protein